MELNVAFSCPCGAFFDQNIDVDTPELSTDPASFEEQEIKWRKSAPHGRTPGSTFTYGVQMLVIKLILVAAVLAALFVGIAKFNNHCASKFSHAFFTKRAFYMTAAAIGVYAVGEMWKHSSQQSHGDPLNGIVLMVVGGLIAAWLVFDNVKQTNMLYGIGGSVVSLGLFSVLAWIWLPLMAIGLVCYFLTLMSAKPVYVVNR
ncbi:hypothetical protein [Trinickia dinghuensis]|uniref:Uncharacterized protein n=1 Tax=Trinickia dinghuensis TaxID=2291023 RepID=A0A3D8JPT9_9BURK|nr:hypothetical protein [Trinickia dinghuensis]RDU94564.1 hypothetical protein DWV00_33335 [Trinickia dinghuensis]